MPKKRFSAEQIVTLLRQVEVFGTGKICAGGLPGCRHIAAELLPLAQALQHDQTALIDRISTACTTDNEPVHATDESDRANAINSLSRWYKKPSGRP